MDEVMCERVVERICGVRQDSGKENALDFIFKQSRGQLVKDRSFKRLASLRLLAGKVSEKK